MSDLTQDERKALFAQCRIFGSSGRRQRIPVTQALHWEREEPIDSPLTTKRSIYAVACGHAISNAKNTTRNWREATCFACMELAIGEE